LDVYLLCCFERLRLRHKISGDRAGADFSARARTGKDILNGVCLDFYGPFSINMPQTYQNLHSFGRVFWKAQPIDSSPDGKAPTNEGFRTKQKIGFVGIRQS
jgi:hypothetical protein